MNRRDFIAGAVALPLVGRALLQAEIKKAVDPYPWQATVHPQNLTISCGGKTEIFTLANAYANRGAVGKHFGIVPGTVQGSWHVYHKE